MFKSTTITWYLAHLVLVLIGLLLYGLPPEWLGEALTSGIASSLIATGMCGAVLYVYSLQSEKRQAAISAIEDAGLSGVFPGRSVSIRTEYAARINKAKNIDVLGFGLSHFRQDYVNKFEDLAKSKNVRILLSSPDYPNKRNNYCDQRDLEEGNKIGQISGEVEQFIADSAEVRQKYPESFQVRRLKMLPSINIFRMDSEILWGPYLVGEQSRNMPTLLVRDRGYLGIALKGHFDKIWGDDELSEAV